MSHAESTRLLGAAACEPGANEWVEQHLHDCVYTFRDGVGIVLGLASLVAWVFALMPQFISNIRNQSAEALRCAYQSWPCRRTWPME